MATIEAVGAREILDSRGNPTVEVEVLLDDDGTFSRAAVPSGASTGAYEANERRDGDKGRYLGKGVEQAVEAVIEEVGPALVGHDAHEQRLIDQVMLDLDGTRTRTAWGQRHPRRLPGRREGRRLHRGPAAVPLPRWPERARPARADDEHRQRGAHADTGVAIQEFMIAPVGAASFREACAGCARTYHALKSSRS